jgi:glucose-6-phosphate isomerase
MGQFMIVRELLGKLGARCFQKQVVVTTCLDENPLHKIAINEKLGLLEIPKYVGGRFSVLSPVGLFSASMCGININMLLRGARDMHDRVCGRISRANPAAVIAALHHCFYKKGKKTSVMMPYSYALKDMADWFRQLWAESLGKARSLDDRAVHVGPTPVKALGATDQHSQLQLYLEGPNDKVFTFLQVEKFRKDLRIGRAPNYASELKYLQNSKLSTLLEIEKRATECALLKMKRPCVSVIFPEVSPYTIGQFIYLYEVTTSFSGALFDINPYNQPSVGAVKDDITSKMLSRLQERKK